MCVWGGGVLFCGPTWNKNLYENENHQFHTRKTHLKVHHHKPLEIMFIKQNAQNDASSKEIF